MSDNPNRRDVLKATGAFGLTGGLATATASADRSGVRVIEAGLYYDVPTNDSYDLVMPDSRPPYTVDSETGTLVLLSNAPDRLESRLNGADNLADESDVGDGGRISVGPNDGRLRALPLELTARMRPARALHLASPVAAPNVTLQPDPDIPTMNVESVGSVELPPGERTEVELDPVAVTARTSTVVGKASVDGVPEQFEGLEREQGTVEVEAIPRIVAINHGQLAVKRQPAREGSA